MGRIGNITPAFDNGEEVRQLRVAVEVFMMPSAKKLDIIEIYEDEGHLCINVQEPKE